MPIISRVVKLVGAGIGAARESYISHQEDKARASGSGSSSAVEAGPSTGPAGPARDPFPGQLAEDAPPPYIETSEEHAQELIKSGKAVPVDVGSETDSDDELEEQWRLDEAAEAIDPPAYEESEASDAEKRDPKDLVNEVLSIAPPAATRRALLPVPVVVPQRRPRTRARGFVRAYAPVLNDCAIDQKTFLTFLKNLHTATQASKGLSVVFLAAGVVGMVPETVAQIVSTVVQVGVGTAIEVQRRYRANAFLNDMNEKLFRPRGLFALVVAYKPNARKQIEVGEYDPTSSIARFTESSGSAWKDNAPKLRTQSGKNFGELDIGEVAPLVYPSIEDARVGETEQQRSAWKKFEKFMGDYSDRRAQAVYVGVSGPSNLISNENLTSTTAK
jgi:hypothetical protein